MSADDSASVSSPGDLRLRGPNTMPNQSDGLSHVIQSFKKSKSSMFRRFLKELLLIFSDHRSKRITILGIYNLFSSLVLLLWCQYTNSMALIAYTYLTFFDLFVIMTCLLSIWIELQKASSSYTFGYERFEVLAVFASTILAQLGALFIIKESIQRILQQPEINVDWMIPGIVVALLCTLVVTYGTKSKAWNHVTAASSSSWLQEHVAEISQSICHVLPGLSVILLPRINPMVLISWGSAGAVFIARFLVIGYNYHLADPLAAVWIALMTCGTMFPISLYTGKILLQTTPSHVVGQLDKCLLEASTLDGVLEFRNEHFWTLSFGVLAGTLHVRIRRDASEQLVLAHLVDRLSNLVSVLTIQVFKDDWTRTSAATYQLLNDTAYITNSSLPNSPAQWLAGNCTSSPRGMTGTTASPQAQWMAGNNTSSPRGVAGNTSSPSAHWLPGNTRQLLERHEIVWNATPTTANSPKRPSYRPDRSPSPDEVLRKLQKPANGKVTILPPPSTNQTAVSPKLGLDTYNTISSGSKNPLLPVAFSTQSSSLLQQVPSSMMIDMNVLPPPYNLKPNS